MEAAITHLLTQRFGDESLTKVFSRLELSNKTIGKIAFAKAQNLLDKNELEFINELSEIRNLLVHDVRNIKFDLNAYLSFL